MSAIDDRYNALGGPSGFLGAPISDEERLSLPSPVHVRIYERGAIYSIVTWPRAGGRPGPIREDTFEVHGLIWEHYQALGREDAYGLPTSDETVCRDGVGRFNTFQDGGAIYWTGPTGAHEIHGAIHQKWATLGPNGAEQSLLGYPTTDETACDDTHGRYNRFQGGSIYWSGPTGAHEIHGAIFDKWSELGWEQGFLGYPTTDEGLDSYGTGHLNNFQDGVIYDSGPTGAYEVHGGILAEWQAIGAERSYLGRPITDEHTWVSEKLNIGGRRNRFEHGEIDWTGGEAIPWPNSYTFTVDGMWVLTTRSRQTDTDRVSATVALAGGPPQTVTQDLGDVGLGFYDFTLTVGPITVDDETGVGFNYLIVNAGNASWDDINNRLREAGGKLAEAGANAATTATGAAVGAYVGSEIGTAALPLIGSAIGAIVGWLAGELTGLLTASCDGAVAAEQVEFRGHDLWNYTKGGPKEFSTIHDGTDSPGICGSNSSYWTGFTLARAPLPAPH